MRSFSRPVRKNPHACPAFMLFDTLIGICMCACALLLAFELLHRYAPSAPPPTYTLYGRILNLPPARSLILTAHSPTATLRYEAGEQILSLPQIENLRFYTPTALR